MRYQAVRFIRKHKNKSEGEENKEIFAYGFKSSVTVPLGCKVLVNEDSEGKERRMGVLHDTMKEVAVRPVQKCQMRGFLVKTRKIDEWKFVKQLVSYC